MKTERIADNVLKYLQGKSPDEIRRILASLANEATEGIEDEKLERAADLDRLNRMSLAQVEDALDDMRGKPGYLGDPEYRALVQRHGDLLKPEAPDSTASLLALNESRERLMSERNSIIFNAGYRPLSGRDKARLGEIEKELGTQKFDPSSRRSEIRKELTEIFEKPGTRTETDQARINELHSELAGLPPDNAWGVT